jgi:hypothetical protein
MTTGQTDAVQQDPIRALLGTLLERWQEVADAYKTDKGDSDDLDLKYDHFRTIYLRNIRDLRHVLDTGRMPCSLMNDEERRRGDCGHVHDDDPWTTASPAKERVTSVIVAHICHLLLDHDARGDHAARDLTWALKGEGVDLSGAVQQRITDLTLGRDPSEPPF